jgi:hypothetical protein
MGERVGGGGFRPTHVVSGAGTATWDVPDPGRPATNRLAPELPVQLLEETTGWARVRCSNGWETWVDAGQLLRLPFRPTRRVPAAGVDARMVPDPQRLPDARLDPGLPVELVDEWNGWARVRCSNEWETWVDGRLLEPLGGSSPNMARTLVVGALPALLVILASVLPWYSAGSEDVNAWDIQVVGLFTHEASDFDLDTGPVLVALALVALALIGARRVWSGTTAAFLVVGVIVLILGIAGLVLYLDLPEPRPELGIGLLLTIGSGITLAVAGFVDPAPAPNRHAAAA